MGKVKWLASGEGKLPPGGTGNQSRAQSARRAYTLARESAPLGTSFDIRTLLNVRLKRLWVAIKYRWYLFRQLLGGGKSLIKAAILAVVGYVALSDGDQPAESVVAYPEHQPVAWQQETNAMPEPAVPLTEVAPAPGTAGSAGGREALLREPPSTTSGKPGASPSSTAAKESASPAPTEIKSNDDALAQRYIERFSRIAIHEMHKYGVPASITLAQGLIESRCGTSPLAVKNNNHFGIKCFSKNCSPGHCTNMEDDHHKDFFRKYNTAWESWRAHSILISTGRYARLKRHGRDYRAWAKGLESLGYATDQNYAEKLIRTIERYNLQRFDKQ
ncbi:MAG: glucosaminidase domain-containing protein [Saprospiraceae bacterium]|nr:glucosaminidase domain-containing protein [Saprospiraceae bacterium]MDW8484075.1 glucosaminidase domain-containing protein [Saprospiraceae bacterium]